MNDYYRMGLQVGATLRRLREEQDLSQEQAAQRLDLPVIHLDLIERGERIADALLLLRAAETFDCPVSALFEPSGECEKPASQGQAHGFPGAGEDMLRQGAALVRAFATISDPFLRDEILRITHCLARRA